MAIDPKACECGCGTPAAIATRSEKGRGWVKGQPLRYARGHNGRAKFGPYYVETDHGYTSPCWDWNRRIDSAGYGQSQHTTAHRVMYERHKGAIPAGLDLDHLCRNRTCVNPDHLEPVTVAENTRRSASAKLTWEQVNTIRTDPAKNVELARRYGVVASAISNIRRGERWTAV